jgi:3'-5' exoribonuclease
MVNENSICPGPFVGICLASGCRCQYKPAIVLDATDDIFVIDVLSADGGAKFSIVVELKAVEVKLAKNNSEYMSVTVGDKTGSFSCKIFGGSSLYNFFKAVEPGSIILLEGISKDYRNVFSPDITLARILTDAEIANGNYARKVTVCANEGVEALKTELQRMISTISDGNLRRTVVDVIADLGEDFCERAAGIAMHHSYKNGLLEHTVHVARAGLALLGLYPFVDRDIALAGLILHDVGKTLEYTGDPVPQKTKVGILHGHLVIGYRLLRKFALQNRLDGEVLERLEHILLSHHTEPDFGAVVRPATPEAVFVALVDNLDAKMGMVEQLLQLTPQRNVFSDFHRGLDARLLVLPIEHGGSEE